MHKYFKDLSEQEILALAIALEEEDSRTYADIAAAIQEHFPASAKVFLTMTQEEDDHRRRLFDMYCKRFGSHLPLIRRADVRGFVTRTPVWLIRNLTLDRVRKQAAAMEEETRRFYELAAARTADRGTSELLLTLAHEEKAHIDTAARLEEQRAASGAHDDELDAEKKLFLLQIIQPGLAGLMDGSVSTLAPLFAAAFATGSNWTTFRVGLAASVGAGISMGFAEALSDDGKLTGRGRPLIRGIACGLMTTAGGLGHTLPYLIPQTAKSATMFQSPAFRAATILALVVVAIELAAISWIRHRFMQSPWVAAAIQVVIGGIIVLLAGILIGS